VQSVCGLGFGFSLWFLAVAPSFPVALLATVFIGGAASGFQSMNNSLVLSLSEFEYHGRIQSLMMLSFSGFGMAALPLGALADAIGLEATFFGMGAVTVAAMSLYIAVRRARPAEVRPALA
jgi:predicted MFS family arabinose efflux permease